MEHKICKVCKTPIEDLLVVETEGGPVHPGPCLTYCESLPLSESTDLLAETGLLL